MSMDGQSIRWKVYIRLKLYTYNMIFQAFGTVFLYASLQTQFVLLLIFKRLLLERNWGGAPHPACHTLAKDMSLNRGATHFTRFYTFYAKAMYYLILPITNIPLKITQ